MCLWVFLSPLDWFMREVLRFGVLDISGVPGTGKTATVHAMVREFPLNRNGKIGKSRVIIYFWE